MSLCLLEKWKSVSCNPKRKVGAQTAAWNFGTGEFLSECDNLEVISHTKWTETRFTVPWPTHSELCYREVNEDNSSLSVDKLLCKIFCFVCK